ncbi:VTT domain-containing protein [Sphingomonas sp. GCM10030256]|uniref:VTT domain-containing protein n=1 Tax=Sphingomonas sp. GCM10030256 TaxID=3273427 RepID=UPI00361F2A3D
MIEKMLTEFLPFLASLIEYRGLLTATVFLSAMALSGLGIPGFIVPLSLVSAALLGPFASAGAVLLGLLAGSQLLFLVLRRYGVSRFPRLLGSRLDRVYAECRARGLWYLIGLRIIGVPHAIVTAGAAMAPLHATTFAAGTLIGFAPIVLASANLPQIF